MGITLIFPYGQSSSVAHAAKELCRMGYAITDQMTPEVTHLILDIPSKPLPSDVQRILPVNCTIIGGNLDPSISDNFPCIDLLHDEAFLCRNAAITAQCAVRIGYEALNSSYEGIPCMVIGYGRIGKHLVHLLSCLGAKVTVAARNIKDLSLLQSFHIPSVPLDKIESSINNQALVFNTVPAPVLSQLSDNHAYIAIDLATSPGILGSGVVHARGLPGKMSPSSAGKLIAQRIHSILSEESI